MKAHMIGPYSRGDQQEKKGIPPTAASTSTQLGAGLLPNPAASPLLPAIVYVDDNVDDRDLLSFAGRYCSPGFRIASFENTHEACQFIGHESATGSPPPVIVCDYQLFGETALDLFRFLRANPALHHLTTIVFSDAPEKAAICYAHGAGYFVLKPTSGQGLCDFVHCLECCVRHSPPRFDSVRTLGNFLPEEPALWRQTAFSLN